MRGKRGWGGPWRAFIRKRTLGTSGVPNLSTLSKAYKQSVENDLEEMQAVRLHGRTVTQVARHAGLSGAVSAFGPKGRKLQRNHRQALRKSLIAATESVDKDAQALAVGQHVLAMGMDIDACLSLARSALRQSLAQGRRRQQDDVAAIRAWQEGPGAAVVAKAKEQHEHLRAQDVFPLPSPQGALIVAPACDREGLSRAVSWSHTSHATNLSSCLKEDWARMHQPLVVDEAAPSNVGVSAPAPCLEAGFCVCSGDGKVLRRIRDQFLSAMKKAFPRQSPQRDLLRNASVVACVSGTRITDDYEEMLAAECVSRTVYWHIGLMYLSPFRPTVMVLDLADDLRETTHRTERVHVKAQCWVTKGGHTLMR